MAGAKLADIRKGRVKGPGRPKTPRKVVASPSGSLDGILHLLSIFPQVDNFYVDSFTSTTSQSTVNTSVSSVRSLRIQPKTILAKKEVRREHKC